MNHPFRHSALLRSSQTIGLPLLVSTAFLFADGAGARAAVVQVYTDKAAFEGKLSAGYYEEPQMYTGYYSSSPEGSYSNASFSYKITVSPSGTPALSSTNESSEDITPTDGPPSSLIFSFSPGTRAFGGYFYANDTALNFVPSGAVSLNINSGAFSTTLTPTTYATSFFGIISDSELNSAELSVTTTYYPSAGTVIVGTVPAPTPLPIAGAAGFFQWSRRLRKRQHAQYTSRRLR